MPDELWTEVHDIVQETGIKTLRESVPRKIDKESRGSPRREGSGSLKEEERTNFFSFSTFLRII